MFSRVKAGGSRLGAICSGQFSYGRHVRLRYLAVGHVFLSLGRRGQVIHVVLSYFKAGKSRILHHV